MYRLGVLYGIGRKIPANIDESIKLLTQAAELNHAESMEALVLIYVEYPNLKYRSEEKAHYWQEKLQQLRNEPKNTDSSMPISLDSFFN